MVFETDLEQKKSKWLQGHFPLGLHFYSFRIGFRISLELRSHDLIFVKTNFIPIVSAIKMQKVECLDSRVVQSSVDSILWHSLIYAVTVVTHQESRRSKNHANRGYIVVLSSTKIVNRSKSNITEIKTTEVKECL